MSITKWIGGVACCCALGTGTLTVSAEEWTPLFNGESLENWDGNPKFWRVEEGAITGENSKENPTDGNTFLVWTGGEVSDFELKLQYRILPTDAENPGGNSGIQYRSFRIEGAPDSWRIGGYQADFETGDTWSGILYGENFRGILAKRGEKTEIGEDGQPKVVEQFGDSAEIQTAIRKEDWNDYHITAQGFHFVHRINGVVTAECTDNDTDTRRASGLLALQLHAGPPMKVQFREILLKRLDVVEAEAEAAGAEDAVEGLAIELRGDGLIRAGGEETAVAKAGEFLAAHAEEAGKGIVLRATADTPMEQVRAVVEACHAAGLLSVKLQLAK